MFCHSNCRPNSRDNHCLMYQNYSACGYVNNYFDPTSPVYPNNNYYPGKCSEQWSDLYDSEANDQALEAFCDELNSVNSFDNRIEMSGGGCCDQIDVCGGGSMFERKERAQIQREICHLESQVASYIEDLESFEMCRKSICRSIQTVQNRCVRLAEEIDINKRELKQARIMSEQKITRGAQIKGQINCEKIKEESVKKYVRDTEDKLQNDFDCQKQLLESLQEVKAKLVQQQETEKDLKATKASAHHKKDSLQVKVQDDQETLRKLKIDLHGVQLEMKVTIDTIFEYNLKIKQNKNCEERLNEVFEEVNKTKENLETLSMKLSQDISELRKDIETAKSEFQTEASQKRDRIRILETSFSEIQMKMNETALEIKKFKESSSGLESEYSVFVMRIERQTTVIGHVKEDISKKQGQKALLGAELNDVKGNINKYNEKKANVIAELETARSELRATRENCKTERNTLTDNRHKLTLQIEKARAENVNTQDKYDALESQNRHYERTRLDLARESRQLERKSIPLHKELKHQNDIKVELTNKVDGAKITLNSLTEFIDRLNQEIFSTEASNSRQRIELKNELGEIEKLKDMVRFANDENVTAKISVEKESQMNTDKMEITTTQLSDLTFEFDCKNQLLTEVSGKHQNCVKHFQELKHLEKALLVKIEGLREGNDEKRKRAQQIAMDVSGLDDRLRMKIHSIKMVSQDISRLRKEMGQIVNLTTKYEREHHRMTLSINREIEAIETSMFRYENNEQEERRRIQDKFSQRLCTLYHKQRKIQEDLNTLEVKLLKINQQGQNAHSKK